MQNSIGDLILSTLASYRIASMIAKERGPFDAFRKLRMSILEYTGDDSHWLYDGITCIMCVGLYISFGISLLTGKSGWYRKVLTALAVSGGVNIIKKIMG